MKMRENSFYTNLWSIALPVTMQSLLQSSFSMIDQVMIGQLGEVSIAGIGLGGKFASMYSVVLGAIAAAAGIMIGKQLGNGDEDVAYRDAGRFMGCGVIGSLELSATLVLLAPAYVRIYQVEPQVRELTRQILIAFAIIAPVKVQNMILGGGIIRSGGKTKYIMVVDFIGTWLFGVPLGLLGAFVWKLPIPWVYFILSLEEVVRLLISIVLFRKKVWMEQL